MKNIILLLIFFLILMRNKRKIIDLSNLSPTNTEINKDFEIKSKIEKKNFIQCF